MIVFSCLHAFQSGYILGYVCVGIELEAAALIVYVGFRVSRIQFLPLAFRILSFILLHDIGDRVCQYGN